MKFYSKQVLRPDSKDLWQDLSSDEEIVITNDGKPAALMIEVSEDNYDYMLQLSGRPRLLLPLTA